jgi:dUTP pyrophosphatase
MALRVKKLSPCAELPTRGSDGAAGYDLYSTENVVILPNKRATVGTGLSIEIPDGTYARIAPRSGLAVKNGIQVGAGVVDGDYRGEVRVVLFNHDEKPYVIKPGYRIAQLILERCMTPPVIEIDSVTDTNRGVGGFGSTGH